MFKPSEKARGAFKGAIVVAGAAAALALMAASIGAAAGVIDAERVREAAPSKKAPPVLLLRCWQEGRLLFEEPLSSVPADARKGAKLSLVDRRGQVLQVFDMQSATCLVRDTPAEEFRQEGGGSSGAARP